MRDWLEMFVRPFLTGLTSQETERVISLTEASLKNSCYREGQWFADYKRLRVVAGK